MKLEKFLIQSNNIGKDSLVWNMVGSMIMAFQSVIMLMILTRVLGLNEAGIFTIAYANANLFVTIGKYGMRNFQVSDVSEQFLFQEYLISRLFTTFIMILVSVIYVVCIGNENEYSMEKCFVIIWMCLFKVVDSLEDVYHGLYQQKGRLDVAGKTMAFRLGITLIVFAIGIIFLKNLLLAVIGATVITIFLLILFNKWAYRLFKETVKGKISFTHVRDLLKLCFPLFLGSFLSFYIGNAPKYAIDSVLNDESQACYGFISMPIFVVGLLNNFIFNPMIYKLSVMWNEGKKKEFIKKILIQILIVLGITCTCIMGAYICGIPILSILYNTDLSSYKIELLILLLGGGFLALSGLLVITITIIRFQNSLTIGYVIVSLLAYILSEIVVEQYLIKGAACLYLVLMITLCFVFGLFLIYGLKRERKF